MPHRTKAALMILVLAVACSGDSAGVEAFCAAARDAATVTPGDVDRSLAVLERMREEAPDEIADAVNTLADATKEAFETQDASVVQRQDVTDASEELDAYLEDNCAAPK
jgi:malonyl CoA-acyl carrier protein transacylase